MAKARKSPLDEQERSILLRIADALAKEGHCPEIPEHLRRAYAAQIRRIVEPPSRPFTERQKQQFAAAYCYALLRELQPERAEKAIRGEVADRFGFSDDSVSQYYSKHGAAVAWFLGKMEDEVGFSIEHRGAALRDQFDFWWPPQQPRKRTRSSSPRAGGKNSC